MDDQFLYRYFDESGALLYNGRSNDWTRRLREHVREDYWSGDIMGVKVERYPSLGSVMTAEAASIRAEHPRYNVQYNRPGIAMADLSAGREWTAGDIMLIIGLAMVAAYVAYQGTVLAIEKYRGWKIERDEFRGWKQARAEVTVDEHAAISDSTMMSADSASVIAAEPVVVASDEFVVAEPKPVIIHKPKPVIIHKPYVPTTDMPEMKPLVAVAFALMLLGQPREASGWSSPLWPPAPPTAQ